MTEDNRLVAGIELGGTKAIALFARGSEILTIQRLPTTDPIETLDALGDLIEGWAVELGAPAVIGIGSFGPVGLDPRRADFGYVTSTPKPGWANVDVAGTFRRRFGVPVAFDTDVAGAALAEHRWGAAQGCDVLVYVTIGTGVGGGVVIGGQVVHGQIHPELGHVRVRRSAGDPFAGSCRFHGDCLEGLVSGPALAARTGIAGEKIPHDHPIWDRIASELSEAMAMLLMTLSPHRIMIGGGVFQHHGKLLPVIRSRTAQLLGGYLSTVDADALERIIVAPGLGDRAGPLGAIALAYRG